MNVPTADSAPLTYTTAGRHRRAVAPGRILLTVRGGRGDSGTETPRVLVNGFPVAVGHGPTLIQVPAGAMRVEIRCPWVRQSRAAEITFDLPEEGTVDLSFTAPRLGFGTGILQVMRKDSAA